VVGGAREKQMREKEAGEILHLGRRQIKRLLKRYRKQGAAGLISKHGGCKAANRLCERVKKEGLDLLKTKYQTKRSRRSLRPFAIYPYSKVY
jgi:hypothetical protein